MDATGAVELRAMYARTSGNLLVNNPEPPITPPTIWWYGSDAGGGGTPIGPNGPWTTATAPALPVTTRATALVVNPIAQSPLKVQELGFAGQPLGTPRWITDPMLLRDDGRFGTDVWPAAVKVGRSTFWADFLRSALWWGIGAFLCQTDEAGAPLAGTLRLIPSHLLSCERDEGGALVWVLGSSPARVEDRVIFDRSGRVDIGGITYLLVVLRNPMSPVDVEGRSMGVFEMSPSAFRIATQIEGYTSSQFRSGIPNGYLKVETPGLQQEQADDLKASWMQAHGNDQRSIAVLNAVTSFVPVSLSPVDAALDQVKRLSIADVAFAFSIDPNMLGAGLQNSATYNNVRDYFRQHRDLGIGLWIAAFQDVLTALLPGTQGVKVDLDAFTRAEPKERYDAYKVALDAGILFRDEVRAMEGLPPAPEDAQASSEDVLAGSGSTSVRALRRDQPWRA